MTTTMTTMANRCGTIDVNQNSDNHDDNNDNDDNHDDNTDNDGKHNSDNNDHVDGNL